MLPKEWLKQFYECRQLTTADGRTLFSYRMGENEFVTLKAALKTSALVGLNNILNFSGVFRGREWSAAFVIYAAEWWRRDYDGSQWSWASVFASFGANADDLSIQQRNGVVESGLRYWRREVRIVNGRSRYLGTIATEGGLPLNQLNSSAGWLGGVFKQAIPKYTRLQNSGVDATELIAECNFIPQTYQKDEIYTILGDMVKTVVDLKRQHQLHDRENPVEHLNQHNPLWRELFPMPITHDVGAKLLSDMIFTAAKVVDTSVLPMRCFRCLSGDGFLQLQFEFAKFVGLEALGLPENIPGRLTIELIADDGKTVLLGTALRTVYQTKPSLKMPNTPDAITGAAALQAYAIRFNHLSETLKEVPLVGGEALDNNVPWVFVQRDGDWHLEGRASFNTRAKQVRIMYPCTWHYTGEAVETKSLPNAPNDKVLLEASGSIRLTDKDGGIFIIKTAQAQASHHYYLRGKQLAFVSTPNELYLGLPILRHTDNELGINRDIPIKQLLARAVNGRGAWQPLTHALQGVYELSLCERGAIIFRKKCVLLPEQFAVCFKPSDNALDGTIYLDNTGTAEVVCETAIEYKIIREDSFSGYRIDLNAEQTPPNQVRVTLHWSGMVEMVTINLPFPARGGQVIDANGNKLPSGQYLFQEQLHGVRLRLFNEQPSVIRHLQVEFMLIDEALGDLRDVLLRHEVKNKGAVIELAVINYWDWMKNLLTVSNGLDSYIRLAIYENGTELLRTRICRYALSLERNLTQGTVELKEADHARLPYETLIGIKLMAMRLSQPEQAHIELLSDDSSEQTNTGIWFFSPERRVAEPWLLYSAETSSVSLRPLLWAVGYEPDQGYHQDQSVSILHSAVKIGQTLARHDTIKNILAQMSKDFAHSGWDYLRQLWWRCPHLPLSSFDVWIFAVTDRQMLAALVLQMDEAFIAKLNDEMPVFWELVPLADWRSVYSAYQNYLLQVIDAEDVSEFLTKRIDKVTQACKSLYVVAKILEFSLGGIAVRELTLARCLPIVEQQIIEELHSLDRRQADRDWPVLLKEDVLAAWQQLEPFQRLGLKLEDIPISHQSVVLLPVVLAVYCANSNNNAKWLGNGAIIFKLNTLKAFDEHWFETVFMWTLAHLSQQNQ